jgi:hypothetical protein
MAVGSPLVDFPNQGLTPVGDLTTSLPNAFHGTTSQRFGACTRRFNLTESIASKEMSACHCHPPSP